MSSAERDLLVLTAKIVRAYVLGDDYRYCTQEFADAMRILLARIEAQDPPKYPDAAPS